MERRDPAPVSSPGGPRALGRASRRAAHQGDLARGQGAAFCTALAPAASQPSEEGKGEGELLPCTTRQGNSDKGQLDGFVRQREAHRNPSRGRRDEQPPLPCCRASF